MELKLALHLLLSELELFQCIINFLNLYLSIKAFSVLILIEVLVLSVTMVKCKKKPELYLRKNDLHILLSTYPYRKCQKP